LIACYSSVWAKHKTALITSATLLILIYLLFFLRFPNDLSRSNKVLIDSAHLPTFLFLSFLLMDRYRRLFNKTIPVTTLITCIVLVSLTTEGLQLFVGRTADWRDIAFNMAGLTSAIILFHPIINTRSDKIKRLLRKVLILILISPLFIYFIYQYDEYLVQHQLPQLADFNSPLSYSRVDGSAETAFETTKINNQQALKINFGTERYSDVDFRYLPSNWSEYNFVNIQLYNPGNRTFSIYFKIYDDRFSHYEATNNHVFYRKLELSPQLNNFRIAFDDINQTADIDFTHIKTLTFYSHRLSTPERGWLVDLFLQ